MLPGRYNIEIYDRPGVRLRLNVWLAEAGVIETRLYGCMTWSPQTSENDWQRRVHQSVLLLGLRWQKRKCDDHNLWNTDAFAKTASESIEVIERKLRVSCIVSRMGEAHLLQRLMFREERASQGGKKYTEWLT